MPSVFDKCIKSIQSKAGKDFPYAEAEAMIKMIRDADERMRLAGLDEAARKAKLTEGVKALQDVEVKKLEASRLRLFMDSRNARAALERVRANPDTVEGIKSFMAGVESDKVGSMDSLDSYMQGLQADLTDRVEGALVRSGLADYYAKMKDEKGLAIELAGLRTEGYVSNQSKEVQGIAKIIYNFQEYTRARFERAGVFIDNMEAYITRQTHDVAKILKDKAGWMQFMQENLDPEKTFGLDDPIKFLESAHDAHVSGIRLEKPDEMGTFVNNISSGSEAAISSRYTAQRVYHFKSPEAWVEYNQRFGTGSLREGIAESMDSIARDLTLLERASNTPVQFFDDLIKGAEEHIRRTYKGNSAELDKRGKQLSSFANGFMPKLRNVLTGETRKMVDPNLASFGSTIRGVQTIAKLGTSTVSSTTDAMVLIPHELAYQGVGMFERIWAPWQGVLDYVTAPKDLRRVMSEIGAFHHGVNDSLNSLYNTGEPMGKRMRAVTNTFFKLNFNYYWDRMMRTGVGRQMTTRLGNFAEQGLSLADMDKDAARLLKLYNIDEPKWQAISQAVEQTEMGYPVITGRGVANLPDEVIARCLEQQGKRSTSAAIARERDALATSVFQYYTDRSSHAQIRPGAIEQAIMTQGTRRGELSGELLRCAMQFKAFSFATWNRALKKEFAGRGESKAVGTLRAVWLIGKLTASGIAIYQAKQMLAGKEPLPTKTLGDKLKLGFAGFAQGGGLSLYGDMLFGEYNRYGRSRMATLVGPTLSQLESVGQIYDDMRKAPVEGDKAVKRFARGIVGVVKENLPFGNLPYTKHALDYLIWSQLEESINPGYLRRKEAKLRSATGQELWLPAPSTVVKPSKSPLDLPGNALDTGEKVLQDIVK